MRTCIGEIDPDAWPAAVPALGGGRLAELAPDQCDICIIDLDALAQHLATWRVHLLSWSERNRCDRFATPLLRSRFVAAHGGLRRVLAHYLDRTPDALAFAAGPQGKPELVGSSIAFNLSHAEGLALVAVARFSVGVDIERCRRFPDIEALIDQILAPSEKARLDAQPAAARPENFLKLWCVKEAFVKATGEGLARPFHSIAVIFADDDWINPILVRDLRIGASWPVLSFRPRKEFAAALVVPPGKLRAVRFLDLDPVTARLRPANTQLVSARP